ncbi:hypothetical protein GCM10017044_20620 [Kordiimonas sediminis]|uniref:Ice-binding protein C-terminal domain-containing protein n=1 Tax=Kordiimonas sediminis TaxID=1735581 RepID=A0A919AU45_9PROT|nr:PEPxxWA-CTERM sorting domain-containing protein [Kordiimonas sediminis]GHF25679.1 hypothetical protein GCM10017044_20620 [Kordiimonas sediminis]
MFKKLTAMVIVGMMSTAAQASTTFDFTSDAGDCQYACDGINYSLDGIGLSLMGAVWDGSTMNTTSSNYVDLGFFGGFWYDYDVTVSEFDAGLGVSSEILDDPQVDGRGGQDDYVVFHFDQIVNIEQVMFSLFGDNDDARIYSYSGGSWNNLGTYSDNPLNTNVTTTTFAVGAPHSNDEFKIRSLSVSAVPEPATWLMLILGFGMAGAATQRRRRVMALS